MWKEKKKKDDVERKCEIINRWKQGGKYKYRFFMVKIRIVFHKNKAVCPQRSFRIALTIKMRF